MSEKQWRVPTIKELLTLVDYSECSPTMSKGCPFKNRSSSYWSSTAYAYYPYVAWNVSFGNSLVLYNGKHYNYMYVRCVRGGRLDDYGHLIINGLSEGQEEFTVMNEEEVRDNRTQLIWQRNAPEEGMTWQDAMDYAEKLNDKDKGVI